MPINRGTRVYRLGDSSWPCLFNNTSIVFRHTSRLNWYCSSIFTLVVFKGGNLSTS